ncbi:MAG: hypothetical protein HY521_07270 [Proteobacteria bacterium]|nr:hypothetical protein [Pseudomonadota bacterium]
MARGEEGREILFELHRIGAYVKVTAIDPETRIEASIVGDPQRDIEALKRAALRKLDYVLARRRRDRPGRER